MVVATCILFSKCHQLARPVQGEAGLVHRVNVYRLNDRFWVCYREDELPVGTL